MFKNALVSTSDKRGLIEFIKPLSMQGTRVVSTGGTADHLRKALIPVVEAAEQTGFPEVMDGRVRTLHPRIHMPLLARSYVASDLQLLQEQGLEAFDLVVVNLYPFTDAKARGLTGEALSEFIDIGGPTLLRAAAKNHHRIAVICDPDDYNWILERQILNDEDRRRLAAKAFAHTARYDAQIAAHLESTSLDHQFLAGQRVQTLRYGENPQQAAAWFSTAEHGLHTAQIRQGKPLSYNNLLDLDAASAVCREFTEPCVIAVKHNNPCGAAIGADVAQATQKALRADPKSVFGGIVASNRLIDKVSAEAMTKIFLECVIAPGFTQEALQIFSKKKDLRVLEWSGLDLVQHPQKKEPSFEFRSLNGGYLVQTRDRIEVYPEQPAWVHLGRTPPPNTKADLIFAWKLCAHLKSNAIVLAADGQTVGLGMGQVNRVEALEQAITRLKHHHPQAKEVAMASDAFFPFADSMEIAASAGIRWVIQPGGSIRDPEVFAKAKELNMNTVLTYTRHFRH